MARRLTIQCLGESVTVAGIGDAGSVSPTGINVPGYKGAAKVALDIISHLSVFRVPCPLLLASRASTRRSRKGVCAAFNFFLASSSEKKQA